jgi:aryl-alcohol dehydrogenase-like predicted oxidoreductase
MTDPRFLPCTRRAVLRAGGALAGAAALGFPPRPLRAADAAPGDAPLPRRRLGRTTLDVTCMTLGTGAFGNAEDVTLDESVAIVNLAIDLGVNVIDTAPLYKKAEEAVGRALGARRKEVVLATKLWADSVTEAERSLANSLKVLKTDAVDILYLHSLGNRSAEAARPAGPVFEWLVKRRKAGACRFIGVTAHNLPGRLLPFIESGEVDVVLANLNFADRHTYNFEERVLPAARKRDVGVVAMKVFGGPDPKTGAWSTRTSKPLVGEERLALAARYALSLPGVASANLGVMTAEQLRRNVETVRRFKPLPEDEMAAALAIGKGLAASWGAHYGPADEPGPGK